MHTLFSEYTHQLAQLVAFKSISTDTAFLPEIEKTVAWLEAFAEKRGWQVHKLVGKETNPVVVMKVEVATSLPTVIVYGHYDVQPASEDTWLSEPWKLTEREGRLYARGVVDNKGQFLIHLVTVADAYKNKKLAFNVTFVLEGNEESGNDELAGLLKDNAQLLKADFALLSDGELKADRPTMDVSFRGGANFTLTVTTANMNAHSGIYGAGIPNAAEELARVVGSWYASPNHRCSLNSLYHGMTPITQAQKDNNASIPFSAEELESILGVKKVLLEPETDFYTQVGLLPMITVTGFSAGYIGTGYNNSVPSSASAKCNLRFVAGQDPDSVLKLLETEIRGQFPEYLTVEIVVDSSWPASVTSTDSTFFKKVQQVAESVTGKKVVFNYCGGSLPVVDEIQTILGLDMVSLSLANEDCGMHAANENFRVDLIEQGLAMAQSLWQESATV